MAKDGTMRGGKRAGAGRKPKALKNKIVEGKVSLQKHSCNYPGCTKLTEGDYCEEHAKPVLKKASGKADLSELPEMKDYMCEKQCGGEKLDTKEIFAETWNWLKGCGCENAVGVQLVRDYAMSVARWIQCEHAVSKTGLLGKHPTTGGEIASPYVVMSQNYMKQVNNLRCQIYQIVKEHCSDEWGGAAQDDVMERLLSRKPRK